MIPGTEEDVEAAVKEHIVHVPDRLFNDLRYPLNCDKLVAMGWGETVTWEEGLRRTVEWYREFSDNWDDVESALVAHPRRGLLPSQIVGTPAPSTPLAHDNA